MEFRDVTFFDNRFPFRDGLLDNTNFSQNDIQAMHKPLRPEPTRSSPRVTPQTTADSDSDSETRPSDPDASSAAGDPIHETADATLARFVATRRLRLHLPAVSFYEDGWDTLHISEIYQKNHRREGFGEKINRDCRLLGTAISHLSR